jgi:hypothetical protein
VHRALYLTSRPTATPRRAPVKEIAMKLVERVKRILLNPETEWLVIENETTSPAKLYTGYIMPLAAIGPVANVIGFSLIGTTGYRVPIGRALPYALATYLLTLIGTYVLALIVDALAPSFRARRSQIQALKLTAYSSTAAWVAGIFALIPAISILGILGLYSLYLLYLGLPRLMKAPRNTVLGYMIVIVLASILLLVVISTIARQLMLMVNPSL